MNVSNQQIPSDLIRAFENDPNAMIPLLPGESYHIGYEPLTEELAFSHPVQGSPATFNANPLGTAMNISPIRIPRGQLSSDRIVKLIHKFINCTNGADIQLPKHKHVPDVMSLMPTRALYYAKLRYALYGGDTVFLTIYVQACKYRNDEYIQVSVDYNRGLRAVGRLFSENLKNYLESDGSVFTRVGWHDRKGIVACGSDIMAEITGETGYVHQRIKKYSAVDEVQFDAPPVLSLMMPEPETEEELPPTLHSPSKPPPSVSLENHSIPTLILRSGIVQKPTLTRDSNAIKEPLNDNNVTLNQCQEIDAMFSIYSPSKPPSLENHSIPTLILRSGIVHNEANLPGPYIDPLNPPSVSQENH